MEKNKSVLGKKNLNGPQLNFQCNVFFFMKKKFHERFFGEKFSNGRFGVVQIDHKTERLRIRVRKNYRFS